MRLRYKILTNTALIALMLAAMWLAFPKSGAVRGLSFGLTTARGHFEGLYADQITVAWVTNNWRSAIDLDLPCARMEYAGGRLVTDYGPSWNQKGYSAHLLPGSTAWVAYGIRRDAKRFRVIFEYHRDGGPVRRAISKGVGILPSKRLPRRIFTWLSKHGFVNGVVHGDYESPWIPNPAPHSLNKPAPLAMTCSDRTD
jgi:hypothetical protein